MHLSVVQQYITDDIWYISADFIVSVSRPANHDLPRKLTLNFVEMKRNLACAVTLHMHLLLCYCVQSVQDST
jgi:hypothetical protein